MDANTIVSLIGSVGFPIVACIGLFCLYNRTLKEIKGALDAMEKTFTELKEVILINRGNKNNVE